jgi:hypothetical protein
MSKNSGTLLNSAPKSLIAVKQNLLLRKINTTGREATLWHKELEFYEATNHTKQDIGQAKPIQQEYKAMRQERDDTRGLADKWLMSI